MKHKTICCAMLMMKMIFMMKMLHLTTINVCAVVMFKFVHIVVTVALAQYQNVGINIAQRFRAWRSGGI
jgi:hypothetical protein